jgi:hypothetical protein
VWTCGHVEMTESLISTESPEVISNRAAGNGRSPDEPPLPDFQGHFHGHDGEPGRLDVGYASSGIGRTSNEAPAEVSHPARPALPLASLTAPAFPNRVSRTDFIPANMRTLRSSPRTLCARKIPSVNQCWHLHRDDEPCRAPSKSPLGKPCCDNRGRPRGASPAR